MVKILDGRVVQAGIKKKLTAVIHRFVLKPHLVIIQIGKRPESTLYIARKKEFGEQIGVKITHARYPQTITEAKLISEINNFNNDSRAHGIIVQIPLPPQLNTTRILNAISAVKDVDGLSAVNLQRAWHNDQGGFRPATARGVLTLLDYYKIPLRGRSAVIIGRSAL